MAQNYIQPGEAVTVPATGAMVAGNAYLLGTGKLVVALGAAAAAGKEVECATTGVYELPKTAPLIINIGDSLYWDDATKKLNKTNTGVFAGWCFKAAISAATTVQIKLAP